MFLAKKSILLLLVSLLLGGCTTRTITQTSITNLTPPKQVRNESGLYLLEALWSSQQQSIRKDSFKAYVKVGLEFYPMRPTQMLPNRWEALVPVPPDKAILNYSFKFDYLYNAIPEPRADSKWSSLYQLEITGK